MLPIVAFNSNVKKILFLLKQSKSGTPGTAQFSMRSNKMSVFDCFKDRANAIGKLLALETLNDDKKTYSFQLWSSANGYLGLEETDKKNATYNNAEQEAGQNV